MALPRLFKQMRSRRSWSQSQAQLRHWYESSLGLRLLAEQQEILDQVLPRCFGQFLVVSGVLADRITLDSSVVPHHSMLSTLNEQIEMSRHMLGLSPIKGELVNLPFDANSVDVMLLHHSLDVEHDVYAVLRELARVMVPGGTMIIVGFNPWSLWGGFRIASKLMNRLVPWSCRFMSQFNLSDWLKLLDFEVTGCEYAFFLPPINSEPLLRMLSPWRLPFGHKMSGLGATYLLVAKKQQTILTPVKPVWRRPRLMPMPIQRSV